MVETNHILIKLPHNAGYTHDILNLGKHLSSIDRINVRIDFSCFADEVSDSDSTMDAGIRVELDKLSDVKSKNTRLPISARFIEMLECMCLSYLRYSGHDAIVGVVADAIVYTKTAEVAITRMVARMEVVTEEVIHPDSCEWSDFSLYAPCSRFARLKIKPVEITNVISSRKIQL